MTITVNVPMTNSTPTTFRQKKGRTTFRQKAERRMKGRARNNILFSFFLEHD
jgi:hypothetical protein